MPPYIMTMLCLGSRAVLHVGPHKIGSTSLQITLEKLRGVLLAQDNFSMVPPSFEGGYGKGPKSGADVANCLSGTPNKRNCTQVLGQFENLLDDARSANQGIILSAEKFDSPDMDIPYLASALRGFETSITVMHRPLFDWLRSRYTARAPRMPMPLEEFVTSDRILAAATKSDPSSLAVYKRYSQHFRDVRMRRLAPGYITDFICTDAQAHAACSSLHKYGEAHQNANKSTAYNRTGCFTDQQWELLWTASVGAEAEAQAIIDRSDKALLNLTELRYRYAHASYRLC